MSGTWVQGFYLGDHFDSATCIQHYIHDVDTIEKTFAMDSTATAINSDGFSETRTIKKVANWGIGNSQGVNIKDHLATDYRSYLILYNCVQGVPIVDVELREGIKRLPPRKIREISEILDDVGVSFFDLKTRHQLGCIEDDFGAA